MKRLNRREFIKLSGLGTAAGWLSGCGMAFQPTPTLVPEPTETPPAGLQLRRPEVIRTHLDGPSRVVHAHHPGVWDGEELEPDALSEMLDAGVVALTGLNDPTTAWGALFAPDEQVGIKVNGGWSGIHVPLVMAVTDRLQAAGVPADQIVIFEDHTVRLEIAGFTVNEEGPGVRCYGNAGWHSSDWTVIDTDVNLNAALMDCHALINMPVVKGHTMAGITCAMKNLYGAFSKPSEFHHPRLNQGMAELNGLPPIRDRLRLIVGDVLDQWVGRIRAGDAILMSFDPVAHDATALQVYTDLLESAGRSTEAVRELASGWLEAAADLGVGTHEVEQIELVEVEIT